MKLDRRNFIKLGALGGGTLALPNPLKLAEKERKPWNRQQARTLRKFRNPKPTTCGLCENGCGLISYREGDRIVMLHGNPDHPVSQGKICARAYGQLDRLYDPDRVLNPKVRDGERGSGKWRDISWAEAYKIIAEKIAPYSRNGGAGLALLQGRQELLSDHLLDLFPQALAVEESSSQRLKTLRRQLYGVTGCRRDFANSRMILNFAADPYIRGDALLSDIRELALGRNENGAHLITVAARLNNTGGRSDSWIPLAPEDYGNFARALAYSLLDQKLFNAKALTEQGLKVSELKNMLQPYAPERIAPALGIKAEEISSLAQSLATRQPAMAIYDEELLLSPDGWHSAAAVELLNLMLGALGRPGGLYYYSEENGLAASVNHLESQKERQRVSLDWFANWILESGNKPVVISYVSNPAYTTFSGKYPHALWRNEYKIPFHLAIDTYLSETSLFADLILPAATELETWAVSDRPLGQSRRVLSLRQPVSRLTDEILLLRQAKAKNLDLFSEKREPVENSRDFNQIVLELKETLLGNGPETAPRVAAWLEDKISQPAFTTAGISWNKLLQDGFQTYQRNEEPASLRLSVTSAKFAAFDEKPRPEGADSFTLIPYSWHVIDNLTANSKYLAEFRHDNPLWIHPARAARLGISEGEEVRVESATATILAKAWISEAIHPQCVAIALGLGHTGLGRVARAQTIAESDPMTRSLLIHKPIHFTPFSFRLRSWDKVEPVWWHEKGNGVDIRRIFKSDADSHVAGMTVVDTTVRIRKQGGKV
ncbi:MAG: molybdopterin-dependent oxidoreductase [Deltaproteobacteria bacterium]|nr:molybdopterin-dependent oxidoreductase [Deltaproteobacteria bacterium]